MCSSCEVCCSEVGFVVVSRAHGTSEKLEMRKEATPGTDVQLNSFLFVV